MARKPAIDKKIASNAQAIAKNAVQRRMRRVDVGFIALRAPPACYGRCSDPVEAGKSGVHCSDRRRSRSMAVRSSGLPDA